MLPQYLWPSRSQAVCQHSRSVPRHSRHTNIVTVPPDSHHPACQYYGCAIVQKPPKSRKKFTLAKLKTAAPLPGKRIEMVKPAQPKPAAQLPPLLAALTCQLSLLHSCHLLASLLASLQSPGKPRSPGLRSSSLLPKPQHSPCLPVGKPCHPVVCREACLNGIQSSSQIRQTIAVASRMRA